MSFENSNPFVYKTPPRHQQSSLVGILGTLPIDSLTPSNPIKNNRNVSVSPIRQEESANLENKAAKTLNGQIYFKSEFADSPYLAGKKNSNYANKSLLSSDVLANPAYEPADADKRPQYRPGSSMRKKDRELSPNITRPVNYPYLSPVKDHHTKDARAAATEVAFRNLNEGIQTPQSMISEKPTYFQERLPHVQESPSKAEGNNVEKSAESSQANSPVKIIGRSTPLRNEIKQQEVTEPTESPKKEQRSDNNRIETQAGLKDSPQKSARNQSAQNGHFVIDGGAMNKSQKVYRYRPNSSIRQEDPVVTEMPYYMKKRALNKSAIDLHEKADLNEGDVSQRTPRRRDLTPELRRTATEKRRLDLLPGSKQKAGEDNGIKTPLSQRSQSSQISQISDLSGKDLLCDSCVNNKMKDMKKENARKEKEDGRSKEHHHHRLNQKMIEHDEELKQLKKEEARKVALANHEAIQRNGQLHAENRKNLRGEPMKHLDKIFEGEEKRMRDKRDKSAEFGDAVFEQIMQKKLEKEKARGAEKSPDFGNRSSTPGEGRALNRRDLSNDIKKQIADKEAQQKEDRQKEIEKARADAERINEQAQSEERAANEKKRLTKEQLKNALEQAIQEKQDLNESKKLNKVSDRDLIDRAQAHLKQMEEQKRKAKKGVMDDHVESLKNQILESKQNKQVDRERSKEPYLTSINGIREHSPDFIQNRQMNKSAEKEQLRETLAEQVHQKRREKEKSSQKEENGTSLQPLAHSLQEQAITKNQKQEQMLKEDKELARQKLATIARAEEEMQKRAQENERKMKEEYRDALNQDVVHKASRKDQLKADKQKDLEAVRANHQNHLDELSKARLDQDKTQKLHKEALEKQMKDHSDNKSRQKSEGRAHAHPGMFSNDPTNRNVDPKLYSCIECTQKFPKQRMTKKKVFE